MKVSCFSFLYLSSIVFEGKEVNRNNYIATAGKDIKYTLRQGSYNDTSYDLYCYFSFSVFNVKKGAGLFHSPYCLLGANFSEDCFFFCRGSFCQNFSEIKSIANSFKTINSFRWARARRLFITTKWSDSKRVQNWNAEFKFCRLIWKHFKWKASIAPCVVDFSLEIWLNRFLPYSLFGPFFLKCMNVKSNIFHTLKYQ